MAGNNSSETPKPILLIYQHGHTSLAAGDRDKVVTCLNQSLGYYRRISGITNQTGLELCRIEAQEAFDCQYSTPVRLVIPVVCLDRDSFSSRSLQLQSSLWVRRDTHFSGHCEP